MSQRSIRVGFTLQNMGMDLSEDRGAVLQLRHILHSLEVVGHQVKFLALRRNRRVLCTSDPGVIRYAQMGLSDTSGFRFFESGIRRSQRELRVPYMGLFDSYRFYEACIRNLSDRQVLHERNALFAIGTALASRRLKIPYVLSLDADILLERNYKGDPVKGVQRLFAQWCARLTYRFADALTCVTQTAKQHFVTQWAIPQDKITVIANGVDTDHFRPDIESGSLRRQLGLKEHPVVIFVGDFWPWHGVDQLVNAFRFVKKAIPQAKMLLVGDGMTRPLVVRQVTESRLDDDVYFTGQIEHTRVPAYLAIADVAVAPFPEDAPNSSMGSPLKLYEYMAAGKAIVTSDIGQMSSVIRHEHNGILVQPGNTNELASAIIALLKNPSARKRLGQSARQQAVEQHSWESYAVRLEEIYRSLL